MRTILYNILKYNDVATFNFLYQLENKTKTLNKNKTYRNRENKQEKALHAFFESNTTRK